MYFATSATNATFFALYLGAAGAPGLTLSGETWNPKPLGGSSGAPVLRSGRAYLGDSSDKLQGLHVSGATNGTSYSRSTSDGQAKGFLWPDRRDDRLYFATTNQVQGAREIGTDFDPLWQAPVLTPSMVLQWPGTDYLFVGDGNGRLLQINVNDQSSRAITLEAGSQIDAPSLDGGNGLVIVGSSSGKVYAVRVPLP